MFPDFRQINKEIDEVKSCLSSIRESLTDILEELKLISYNTGRRSE